ncbi:hypothetical protein PENTCL1PPCAC_5146, partial [Pristionchus entomophagus]
MAVSPVRAVESVTEANYIDLEDLITTPHDLLKKYREDLRYQQAENRKRIKVTINQEIFDAPLFALHELFVGEKDPSKTSYFKISIDGKPAQRQKSSGIIISFAGANSE